jgi:PAS domain S-box-containing protein
MRAVEAAGLVSARGETRVRAGYLPSATAAFLVFASYYIGAKLGLALTFTPNPISVLWPPNAILLATLILAPVPWWPALLAAALPAHLLAELQGGVPVAMVLAWFASNASEALIGAALVRWLAPAPRTFDSLPGAAAFVAGAALFAPFLSSFLDAAFVKLIGWGSGSYWELWRTRFFSNVLATLAFVPAIVTCAVVGAGWLRPQPRARYVEGATLLAGLLAVAVFVFALPAAGSSVPPGLLYLPLPFLLWAALRFGPPGASIAFTLVSLLVIWGAAHGDGPFVTYAPAANALSVQLFLSFVGITLLAVAAMVQERRTAEQNLRLSEAGFAAAFRHSPDAMLVSRVADGTVIEANDRLLAMLGTTREKVVGRGARELDPFAQGADRERLRRAIDGDGNLREMEMTLRSANGETVHASVSSQAADVAGEPCLITIIRDISDRKRAEEANDRLAHVSRLAVMGELTASIAHEINQPLGAILSNADAAEILLGQDPVPVDELRHVLDDIRKDDIRAGEVMRHMRSLLRKRELTMGPLDLNSAVRDVLELAHADLDRRRVPVVTSFGQLPLIRGDTVHLQQVVLNLILNGVDAMDEVPPSRRRLEVRTTRSEAGGVELAVSDMGPGFAPEQVEQLFQSFYTTKKEGMGLGLAIARSIIEAHGGRIWAETRPEGGATFCFRLPGTTARAEPRRTVGVNAQARSAERDHG